MAEKRKIDPTVPAIIGVIVLVVILANVMPSCKSDTPVSVDVPGTTGQAANKAPAKWPVAWLTSTGDPYGGKLYRSIDAPSLNKYVTTGKEVGIGTDGTDLVLTVTVFGGDVASAVRDASETELWLNDSLDVFVSGPAADADIYRFTADVAGRTSLQRYTSNTGGRDKAGSPVTTTASAAVEVLSYGWEAMIRIPLADVGISSAKADDTLRLQIHENRRGLKGDVHALIGGTGDSKAADMSLANLATIWVLPPPAKPDATLSSAPKTEPAYIAYVTDIQQEGPIAMPAVRTKTGEAFTTAATDFRVSTDGKTVRVDAYCTDPTPAAMVTQFSDESRFSPFRDDSVEIFFLAMTDGAPWYYQVCVSNTGAYQLYRCKNVAESMILRPWDPGDRLKVVVKKHPKGFDVHLWVPTADIGVAGDLAVGDQLRMQLVRNWRGQHLDGSELLQLFPAGIYAKEFHLSNHHREAFVPCHVVEPEKADD